MILLLLYSLKWNNSYKINRLSNFLICLNSLSPDLLGQTNMFYCFLWERKFCFLLVDGALLCGSEESASRMQLILSILTHFSIDSEGFYSLFQVTEYPACLLEGQLFEKLLGSASTYMATRSVCFSTFCSCSEISQEPTRWRFKNRSLPYSIEDNQSRSVWNLLFCSDLHYPRDELVEVEKRRKRYFVSIFGAVIKEWLPPERL